MKELVVISGKGGTGKTSITASLAYIGGEEIVIADCDVDAADMHLLLQPDFNQAEDFYSGKVAEIDADLCTRCGKCAEVCRFDAVHLIEDNYIIDALDCEGCGYCQLICPAESIHMEDQNIGKWYLSTTKTNTEMVHARLGIGAENSGKLVAKVKNEAKTVAGKMKKDIVIVDGAPGIGCPVISSLAGADFVILVTEPTVSGLHDLKRVHELVKKFKIKSGCIINKSDLNPYMSDKIAKYLDQENIIRLANLPYDESFTKAMTIGQTIIEYSNNDLNKQLAETWYRVKKHLFNEDK